MDTCRPQKSSRVHADGDKVHGAVVERVDKVLGAVALLVRHQVTRLERPAAALHPG